MTMLTLQIYHQMGFAPSKISIYWYSVRTIFGIEYIGSSIKSPCFTYTLYTNFIYRLTL
jgi:hypothetical protein